MRALVQRVSDAAVRVDDEIVSEIGAGLLILVCAMQGDTEEAPNQLANKIAKLRIFGDDQGKMNRSLLDVGRAALVVSQFTLAADTSRGNRPGFSSAAPPGEGEQRYHAFAGALKRQGVPLAMGRFGADMKVTLTNDGPVTIWMDTT